MLTIFKCILDNVPDMQWMTTLWNEFMAIPIFSNVHYKRMVNKYMILTIIITCWLVVGIVTSCGWQYLQSVIHQYGGTER